MRITELHPDSEHELVLFGEEPAAGYRAVIAIHSTRLGPAVGGTRLWTYPSDDAAVDDALRLARGMSYKNAVGCAADHGAVLVAPEAIVDVPADVYAPCALGATLNEETIPRLTCQLVVGAANNQLRNPADAARLADRGILYAPDYVANAGGVLDGAREICGWSSERARAAVEGIYDTLRSLLLQADAAGLTAAAVADQLAESRLAAAAPRA